MLAAHSHRETDMHSSRIDPSPLEPPQVLAPLDESAARDAIPLPADTQAAVEAQVDRFITGLLTEAMHSDGFRARLDAAVALGREEISVAASLMQGRLLQRNFVGTADAAAFDAIQDMRAQLDRLNPGGDGDLLQPRRLFGLIPFGNRLKRYFRRFEGAALQLERTMQQLYAARDDMQRDLVEIESTRSTLWESMQKLKAAVHFAEILDSRLRQRVDGLKASDAPRASAIEQEVLFPARQNLQDMLTQQAVCSNGYLALDLLKKTARETINGCTRVATTGMSALAVAQTVARATGNQVRVMNMLTGVNGSIERLIADSGKQLGAHAERSARFAGTPLIGIDSMKAMFEQTFEAMDALDAFRSGALQVMQQNNAMIREQLARADRHIDRHRQMQVREAVRLDFAGPVAL